MLKQIKYIVIHCTATPASRELSKKDLERMHKGQPPHGRGWKHFGYHYLVHLNGEVEQLQPLNEDGWIEDAEIANGVKGYNDCSIHIAYVGGCEPYSGKPKDTRTQAQKTALRKLVRSCTQIAPSASIKGHRDFPGVKKACPCFDVATQL